MINKSRIKRSFSKAAGIYDKVAHLPSEMALSLLEEIDCFPKLILDVGVGTGSVSFCMAGRFPQAKIFGCDIAWGMVEAAKKKCSQGSKNGIYLCQGDAESLPYSDGVFDLVISNAVYQWVENLDSAFREAGRVLARGGYFAFTTFGQDTLCELHHAFKRVDQAADSHGQKFIEVGTLAKILKAAHFEDALTKTHRIKRFYSNVDELLTGIRQLGAKNVTLDRNTGLGNRRVINEMKEFYNENFREDGKVFATFQIISVSGRKPK